MVSLVLSIVSICIHVIHFFSNFTFSITVIQFSLILCIDLAGKQRKKARENYICDQGKPFVVTPHHAAVAKRDWRMSQTSVTARGPYVPPHEAHRRFFFDRRKWLEGPWHIPAPSGSFTMRGEAFAAASAQTKGTFQPQNKSPRAATKSGSTRMRSNNRGGSGRSPRAQSGIRSPRVRR
jgi:hypothetical protein